MKDEYAELRASYKKLIASDEALSYGKLALSLGISKGALHKFCNDPSYVPDSDEIRDALGIGKKGEVIVQVATRDSGGRFTEGRSND